MSLPEIHQALVDRLVRDVRPVRPLRSRRLFFAWLALQAAVPAVFASHGLRADIGAMFEQPLFVAQVLALVASGMLAAWLAARGAFPDRAAGLRSVAAMVTLALAGLVPLGTSAPQWPDAFVAMGTPCFTMTVMIAALPWLALLLLVGRGASVMPARAGLLAGAAAFLPAAAGMRAACSLDEPWHLLVWHGAPVVLGGAISALLGAAFLGRWAASCPVGARRVGGRCASSP